MSKIRSLLNFREICFFFFFFFFFLGGGGGGGILFRFYVFITNQHLNQGLYMIYFRTNVLHGPVCILIYEMLYDTYGRTSIAFTKSWVYA